MTVSIGTKSIPKWYKIDKLKEYRQECLLLVLRALTGFAYDLLILEYIVGQ